MRPDWDTYFLNVARAVAARADCTRRQVGAVVVDASHRVLSVGYNGAPPGVPGCASAGACPRGQLSRSDLPSGGGDYDHCVSVHAEANALLYSDPVRRIGGTLYCTDEPCPGCRKLIDGAGIARVVVR
jgi:dCMP deaminase